MTHEYGLGRIHVPDDRDRRFPMEAVIPAEATRTHRYHWPDGWWGDQRSTPQCVAYAWTAWLEDGPRTHAPRRPQRNAVHGQGLAIVNPPEVYRDAQRVDQWPGENYDGTSVRAGAAVLQSRGLVGEYRWAWNLDATIRAVLEAGPVVVGTLWYGSMFEPDAEGFVTVSGQIAGGHAYLLNGCNTRRGVFRAKNSWGRGWGDHGSFWVAFEDMERLIREEGEVCLATELAS